MNLSNWVNLLAEQLKATTLLEWIAVVFGVIEVLLAKRNKVLLYPAGIISIITSSFLLFESKLYAETALNMYYLVMSIYGWAIWKSKAISGANKITLSNRKDFSITLAIVIVGWVFLYLTLLNFTDSDVPMMDAFVSSTAWAGMWLLAKRKLENWIWLNLSNLVAIPLLIHKQLIMFAILTVFLFVVAIFGYFDWKRKIETENIL
ncbi:MAG: nicotinamide riboside transporter PnuC [Pelobium sp.]